MTVLSHSSSSVRDIWVCEGRGLRLVGGAFELRAPFWLLSETRPDASCDWAPGAAIGANQRCIGRRRGRWVSAAAGRGRDSVG